MLGISGKEQAIQYGTRSFTKYRTVAGIEGRTWGTFTVNNGLWNNSYGVNMTTQALKGSPSKISNTVTHTGYGPIGTGGVGKVFLVLFLILVIK